MGDAAGVADSRDPATLKDRRNDYEYQALVRLAEVLPTDRDRAPGLTHEIAQVAQLDLASLS